MNNTVTYQITVQPYTEELVSVRLSVATYTTSGRQKWEQLETHTLPYDELHDEVKACAAEVEGRCALWRADRRDARLAKEH